MFLSDLLLSIEDRTVMASPDETVAELSRRLGYRKRGMAVICDANSHLLGVVSVMDIIRALGDHEEAAPTMRARDVMNTGPVVGAPGDRIETALKQMSTHGIRHLPVVEDGILQAVVNIRDLLEARSRAAEMTAEELSRYVYGAGYH